MAAESAILVAIGTAMASGLLKTVLEKSADALSKTSSAAGLKSAISGSLKPQLVHLDRELSKLDALLRATESRSPVQQNGNDLVLLWLGSVREAANFADHVLEDISYDRIRRQVEKSTRVTNLLCGSDGSLQFRMKMGRKLDKFRSMTAEIYKEAAEIGLRPVELVANPSSNQPPPSVSTDLREIRENVDTSIVVGRQHDEDLIVHELSRPHNDQVLGVLAIVGMSGVGKTALARKIYDNKTVKEHYKKKTWIFVSNDFNLRRLLDEMLQSLTGDSHSLSNIDTMERKIQKSLDKDRYLLVLDDVWNTDKHIWDSIRASLVRITDRSTGSIVLVTTQSKEAASAMDASLTHQVRVLPTRDAWALFEAKAFANKSQQKVSDLRDIGEKILKKCGGLPLAINTLASLLGSMDNRSEWESVERSELWNLSEGQTKIMPWLLLSFNHLATATLKLCFAHCSVGIPRGGSITEEALINNWIAQGLIQPSEATDKGMVVVGRKYIKSMLSNGFLQSSDGGDGVPLFSMHDLIHDLALYVSRDRCLIVRAPDDLHSASSGVEHVRIYGVDAWNSQLRLRTLIFHDATISMDLVAQARFLRQLYLIGCGLKEIPKSIGRLKHLRILCLNNNPFKYLPKSIGRLYNLHVLSLEKCHRLAKFPLQVTKMLSLRSIHTTKAMHIPKGMGQLTRLTHLPIVKLKAGDGCKLRELSSLLHLSGEVVIKRLENVSCKKDAMEAGLKMKAGITYLKLIWTSNRRQEHDVLCSNDEEVMEGLQPHSNLKVLRVENFSGKRFAPWLSNGLDCNNMIDMALFGCRRCERLPTLGLLPFLKFLLVDGMESVETMGSDFFYTPDQRIAPSISSGSGHNNMSETNLFPRLVSFKLYNMPKLKDWSNPSGSCASAFPCLEGLYIKNCPLLVSVPSWFPSLKQLTVSGIRSDQPLLVILSISYKNLSSLIVENVHQLTHLSEPLLKCSPLRELRIRGCKELVELPPTLQSLHYLQTLDVRDCDRLTSFPDTKGLVSSGQLNVVCCNNNVRESSLESCVSSERDYIYGIYCI